MGVAAVVVGVWGCALKFFFEYHTGRPKCACLGVVQVHGQCVDVVLLGEGPAQGYDCDGAEGQ